MGNIILIILNNEEVWRYLKACLKKYSRNCIKVIN